MKIIAVLGVCLASFFLLSPCHGAERLSQREKRRKARKQARKSRRKVVEAQSMREMFKDHLRLVPETEGKAGKIRDQKPPLPRLEYNLAVRMRKLFKLTQEKLGKKRDLLAQTAAAERRAKAEEDARMKAQRLRKKRKVDLTVFFDW